MASESEHGEAGVRVERRGHVVVWTIDRADRRNALDRAAVGRLGRLAQDAADDADVRAVVITGSGEQAFSAGADLKERQTMSTDDVRDYLALCRHAFGAIDRLGGPVVAALNGSALGGGLELALACDLRVMANTAEVGLTEVSLGIIPGAGGTQRLTRVLGPAKAKELILLARRLDAREALALGLVNWIAEGEQTAFDVALGVAERLAEGAPIAMGAALDAIDAAVDTPLEEGLTYERTCYERTLDSADRREALAAFRDKRKPVFKGR